MAVLRIGAFARRASVTIKTLRYYERAGPLREAYVRFGADQRGYQLPKRFIASTVAEYRTELQLPFAQA